MKRFGFALVALVAFSGCSKMIQPGYVGIKVNQYGSYKGIEKLPLQTGRVFYNPWTERVYDYPIFMQNVAWTHDPHEGGEHDQSMMLSSQEGTSINCDVGVNYTFIAERVPNVFITFRQEPDQITSNYLRTQVRNAFMRETTHMPVMAVMGGGQDSLFRKVARDLNDRLEPVGFRFDMVTFISKPRPSGDVEQAINSAIAATQRAIEAENTIRQTKALAQQKWAEAQGDSLAIVTRAMAQARSNDEIGASLRRNPDIIRWKSVEKWNGVQPQVLGSGTSALLDLRARE